MSTRVPRVNEMTTVRAVANGTIVAQATSNTNPTFNFTLGSSNIGAGFFDQYKILAIRFNIRADNNAIGLVTNSTTTFSPLYCVIDYDDSTALTSTAAAEAYSNCLVLPPGQSCSRLFRPRIAMAAYSGAFTGFANMQDQWIDSASNTVQHYGIKVFIPGVTAGQTQLQSWSVSVEYFIQLRKSI